VISTREMKYKILVGKFERKRPFERPGRRSYKEIVDGAVE